MESWEAVPDVALKAAGPISDAFLRIGIDDFRTAARHVNGLPYGRNLDKGDPVAVLREGRGTCSTKHALLRRLASEQGIGIALMIGIYEMTERNTPGVGRILARYGLERIPEAHCHMRYRERRIDVTRSAQGAEEIGRFIHEEEIAPEQIGEYKVGVHQRFMRRWIEEHRREAGGIEFEEMWRIREECIAALSGD